MDETATNWTASRVFLITGASSGLGQALAEAVIGAGGRAILAVRRPETVADLVAVADGRAVALRLDLERPESIAPAIAEAEAAFGRIDVLVNNAGRGLLGGIEESSEAEMRAVFEINVFGLALATSAALPEMRARRSGWIVNLSSAGGFAGAASSGFYCASKFAVEGYSEALAEEVVEFGIGVMLVEPGPFRTSFSANRDTAERVIPDYELVAERRANVRSVQGKQRGDPARAAEVMLAALASEAPPFRLPLGRYAADKAIATHDARSAEAAAWREQALSADFPDGAGLRDLSF